jgi:hypothetical protein
MVKISKKYVFAASTCSVAHPSGIGVTQLTKDEVWDADDDLVRSRPDLFVDEPAKPKNSLRGRPKIEQATAAPGETR